MKSLSKGQQAPGFCAQKSSNFCAFDPAGGGVSLDWLSAPAVGAAAPPPVDVPPVDVPPVPVESVDPVEVPVPVPVGVPVDPVEPVLPVAPLVPPELEVGVGVGVGVASELLPSSEEPPEAGGASADCGIGTSA
jgi:hypothetical protein